jgi:uncharacterized protein
MDRTPTRDFGQRYRVARLAAIGVAAGVLSGLLGVGGGLVIVPALVLFVGVSQHRANATSLAAIVPISLVAAVLFGGARSVDVAVGIPLAVGAVVGVTVGAAAMAHVREARLRQAFGVFILAVAVFLAIPR